VDDPRIPPFPGDEHYDLGIWHVTALPADKHNGEGYRILKERVDEWTCNTGEPNPWKAVMAVRRFHNQVVKLVDAIPEEEICSRSWSVVLCNNPLFNIISMIPDVATKMAPKIVHLAKTYGLVCYDPQNDTVSLPPSVTNCA
jgi:hypothetical protein